MSCRGSLEYTCPSHGGWGMVRIGMLIPECHQLFVCPSACGRHGALGAIQQGFKDRLSYLYLEESDIISGYDNAIGEAVEELLKRLPKTPKVILIFVSCLDDLIGTDGDAVIEELSVRFPDIRFRMGHMNPISTDSDEPPLVTTWKSVYSLMEWNGNLRKPAINMIGNYVPIHKDSELLEVMKALGVEVHHIGNYNTYEELKDMGNHYLNLLLSSKVEKVGQLLERTQKIKYLNGHITYDFREIRENYRALFEKLEEIALENGNKELEGMEEKFIYKKALDVEVENAEKNKNTILDGMSSEKISSEKMQLVAKILTEAEKKAKEAIAKAKEVVGEREIYVDYSAFGKPLEAAKFLKEQGFHVRRVYVKDIDEENEVYQWLTKETDIEVIKANHHVTVNKWRAKTGNSCHCASQKEVKKQGEKGELESMEADSISIGMEAAYISGSPHVVPVFQNEGMYGFHGVKLLMEKLVEAAEKEADIEEVIRKAGLVV